MAVKIGDVILGLRSRLGDVDASNYKYADTELIDAINSSLAHLSEELLCFSRTWLLPAKENIHRYKLPEDFLRPISVSYECEIINRVLSMESRSSDNEIPCLPNVSYDMQTLHLYPSAKLENGKNIELYYHYYETINDKTDKVGLPNIAKECIIYYALSLLFENNITSRGIEKANRARKLYELELEKLRSRERKNQQSKNITSKYRSI